MKPDPAACREGATLAVRSDEGRDLCSESERRCCAEEHTRLGVTPCHAQTGLGQVFVPSRWEPAPWAAAGAKQQGWDVPWEKGRCWRCREPALGSGALLTARG